MKTIFTAIFLLLCTSVFSGCALYPKAQKAFYQRDWGNLASNQAVLDRDFPDPDVIKVDDTYYAYATISMGRNIQAAKSYDLINWEWLEDALPELPAWSSRGDTWAPDVLPSPDGSGYLMYYVTHSKVVGRQCIDLAFSENPAGPYRSTSEKPLICQEEEGGSIDPATFRDLDGNLYLLWKNDGNSRNLPTWIYIQALSGDGLSLVGEPRRLISNTLAWEGNLIEAPTLYHHDNRYYLFYSANAYYDERYAVGVAVSDSLLGPYNKAERPFLYSGVGGSQLIGPGGQDIVVGFDGKEYIAFHGWDKWQIKRKLYLERLYWVNGMPSMTAE